MVTEEDTASRRVKLAVVGLGYAGLPLAVAFTARADVIGINIDGERFAVLCSG